MNMRYMVGNPVCFPTSCWRMVVYVILDTGGGCGECDGGIGVACVSGGVAVCVWCDVDVMAISENPCLWWN